MNCIDTRRQAFITQRGKPMMMNHSLSCSKKKQ